MGARGDVPVGESGFSLFEVVIALVVLLVVLVPVSSLVATALTTGGNSRLEEVATDIASSDLDAQVESGASSLLGEMGFSALGTVTKGSVTYSAELDVSPGTSACAAPQPGVPNELSLQVWVTWAKVNASTNWWSGSSAATKLVSESTYAQVPASALAANEGSILLTVESPSGVGIPDVSVTASDPSATPSSETTTTTSSGCALFSNIATGSWTVTATDNGYVDTGENLNSVSQSLTVGTGSPTVAAVKFAQPATVSSSYAISSTYTSLQGVTGTWNTPTFLTAPPYSGGTATAMPLYFFNAALTANNSLGTTSTTDDPYPATPPASVYPFNTTPSYTVVSGDCSSDSYPDGSATDGVAVNVNPGSSATASFSLTGIDVAATLNGSTVSGATITATPSTTSGAADANCPTPSAGPQMPTIDLGTTACPGTCTTSYETGGPGSMASAVLAALDVPIPGTTHRPGQRGAFRRLRRSGQPHHAVLTATQSTTTTVGASPTSSVYGQSVTFTATVTSGGSDVTKGTVTFTYGSPSTTLCSSVSLSSSGTATCTTSALPVGSDSVTAAYGGATSGGTTYGSSSGSTTETVGNASTTTGLTSSGSPSMQGNPVTFDATVSVTSPGAGTPAGTVTYEYSTTPTGTQTTLCTETMSSGEVPSCSSSSLPLGTDYVTAVYSGNADFNSSSSSQFTQTVNAVSYSLLSGLPYGTWKLTGNYVAGSTTYNSSGSGTTVVVVVNASGVTVYDNGSQVGSEITTANFASQYVQVPL